MSCLAEVIILGWYGDKKLNNYSNHDFPQIVVRYTGIYEKCSKNSYIFVVLKINLFSQSEYYESFEKKLR